MMNNEPKYFVVMIDDFFGPREPKARLVKASSEEDARVKTRMGNPDLLIGFERREDVYTFIKTLGWTEIEEQLEDK
jgi:hypothetical protein